MLQNIRKIIVLMIVLSLSVMAFGRSVDGRDSIPRISLITCYAGSDIYELCGHTALRIQINESDDVVNYGLFDFDSPNFVYRFVKGETDYRVGMYPFRYFIAGYKADNRRVVEQQLNLTPVQSWRVIELIYENLRPENCVYRYNYVKNNCATCPIEIIEKAIGDTITFSEPNIAGSEQWTFRNEMRYFHRNYAWYQFGIDLALGKGLDYKLPVREKMFAPEALMPMLDGATISDSIGNSVPLVKNTIVLNEGSNEGAQLQPTPWYLTPIMASVLLFIITLCVTIRDLRNRCVTRWFDTLLFFVYGLMGCVLTFLIFVSVHEATSPNYNYMWLNPLCFIPSIAIWLKKCKGLIMCYHFLNFVALIALMCIWNWLGQSANWAFIPLILCSVMRSGSFIYINKCVKKTV